MGFFNFFLKEESKELSGEKKLEEVVSIDDYWIEVPAHIEADLKNYAIVSLIATAIAAGDSPKSSFVIKKVLVRNPKAKEISMIASCVAASDKPDSKFIIKQILEKVKEEHHVKKV